MPNIPLLGLIGSGLMLLAAIGACAQVVGMLTGRHQPRFEVVDGRFRIIPIIRPLHATLPGLLMAAGIGTAMSGASGVFAEIDGRLAWLPAVLCAIPLLATVGLLVFISLRPAETALTPAGVAMRTPFGSREIPWEALLPGGPLRPPLGFLNPASSVVQLATGRPDLVRQQGWLAGWGRPEQPKLNAQSKTHAWLIADAIRWYVEHPEDRAAIGSQSGHDRLVSAVGADYPRRESPAKGPRPLPIRLALLLTYLGVGIGVLVAAADLIVLRVFADELAAADAGAGEAFFTMWGVAGIVFAVLAGVVGVLLARATGRGSDPARIGLAVIAGLVVVSAICPVGSPSLALMDSPLMMLAWSAERGVISLLGLAVLVLSLLPASKEYCNQNYGANYQ